MIMLADSEGPDQTVQMHRLISTFTVCMGPKTGFHIAQPILYFYIFWKG